MYLITRLLVLAIGLLTAIPVFAQNRRGDQWVATWATALVSRPLPQGGPRGQGPAPTAPQAPAAAPAMRLPPAGASGAPATPAPTTGPAPAAPGGGRGGFPPPTTLTNQTIRQIVRTSIGGSSRSHCLEQCVRHRADRGRRRPRGSARQGRGDRRLVRETADVRRRVDVQRPCRARRSSAIPST